MLLNNQIESFAKKHGDKNNNEQSKKYDQVMQSSQDKHQPIKLVLSDILCHSDSGIIKCTQNLLLELLLQNEMVSKLIFGLTQLLQILQGKLIQINPEFAYMNLDSEENIQIMN